MSKSEDSIIASIRDLRLRIKYGTTYVAQSERKVGNLKGSFEILIEKFLKPRPQTIAFLENESLEQYSQTTKSRFLEFAFHLRLERNEEKMAAKIESISKENEELFKKEQSFLDMVNLLLSIQTIFGNSKNNIDYFTNIEKNNLIPNAQLWKIPKQIDIKLESLKSIELKQTNTTTTNMKTLTIGNDFIIFNDQELIRVRRENYRMFFFAKSNMSTYLCLIFFILFLELRFCIDGCCFNCFQISTNIK